MNIQKNTFPSTLTLYRQELWDTLRLSYPIVVAQIGLVAMGVTDSLMVGHYLGEVALGASGIANSIFFVVCVIGIGVMSILAPLTASAKSQQNTLRCGQLLRAGLQVGFLIGLLSLLVILVLSWNFAWFRQSPAVTAQAVPYLQIVAVSVLPMMLFLAFKGFSDGLSITQPAMYITFFAFFINILLNWLLIEGHWGLPPWGLNGAGLATLLSRTLMWMGLYLIFQYSNKIQAYIPFQKGWMPQWEIIQKIMILGLPAGFQYLFEAGAFAAAAVIIGWLGESPLAAHQIAISMASITYMIAAGFAAAGSIRVGDAWGARNSAEVQRNGSVAFGLAAAFMLVSCLTFIVFNQELVHLYIQEGEVVGIAASLMIIAGFFQLSDGVQCAALGALRGLEDVNIPTLFALVAYWVIGLPLGYWLAFEAKMGIQGVWIGLSAGLTVSAFLLTSRFYILAGQKKRYQQKALN
ncbi:MAG: MATE family efflux transporter [Microscillaceae bacterium]